jgi:hypothetical protein
MLKPASTAAMVEHFASHGFAHLGTQADPLLSAVELARFTELFDESRENGEFWEGYYDYQTRNCEPLRSNIAWDELLRHPKIVAGAEAILGGPVALGEACLRYMPPQTSQSMQRWHRDTPHALRRPHRCGFVHLMLYLSDVDGSSPCWSISPEASNEPVLNTPEQLKRGGVYDLHGPAGTAAFFNLSVLHAATVRPCERGRKSVQVYYGHRDYQSGDKGTVEGWLLKLQRGHTNSGGVVAPPLRGSPSDLEAAATQKVHGNDELKRLSEFTSVPRSLREHENHAVREFYGNLKAADDDVERRASKL